MAKRIIFAGKADVRHVSVADLKQAGVEDEADLKPLSFLRNIPIEVSDLLFEALVTDEPGLFGGGFKKAPKLTVKKTEEDGDEDAEADAKEKTTTAKAAGKTASVSSSSSQSTPSGNGSSTD